MITAIIKTGFNDQDPQLSRAMEVKGYSHCGPIAEYWTPTGYVGIRPVYFKRRSVNDLDSDLRRNKVFPYQYKEKGMGKG